MKFFYDIFVIVMLDKWAPPSRNPVYAPDISSGKCSAKISHIGNPEHGLKKFPNFAPSLSKILRDTRQNLATCFFLRNGIQSFYKN